MPRTPSRAARRLGPRRSRTRARRAPEALPCIPGVSPTRPGTTGVGRENFVRTAGGTARAHHRAPGESVGSRRWFGPRGAARSDVVGDHVDQLEPHGLALAARRAHAPGVGELVDEPHAEAV